MPMSKSVNNDVSKDSPIVERVRCKWTGRSAVSGNERLTVVCSSCR